MTGLVDRVLGLPGWLVLLVAGLVVFAEDALFVGFVIPGETVAVLAGGRSWRSGASAWTTRRTSSPAAAGAQSSSAGGWPSSAR
jgi:membrane protein DedA with SNARE-associated domain